MSDEAWSKQSESLVEVQKYGSNLEKQIRELLDWDSGKVIYDPKYKYTVQTDCVYPSTDAPQIIASVTYANPDKPGHSNENKLQLKVGELALLKNAYPDLTAILILGGTREAWLPYVLQAFEYFFDKVYYLWDDQQYQDLMSYSKNPYKIPKKHEGFWAALRGHWGKIDFWNDTTPIPIGLVRYAVLDKLKQFEGAASPAEISNQIARFCMEQSIAHGGTEWGHFQNKSWSVIEMSRSYFNPVEALTHITLERAGVEFQGGLAKDIEVESLLHKLGMHGTKLSEDFILFSEKLQMPVYIQCKASGGGRQQHGKNIQNRTKEQISRSILYTAALCDKGIDLTWHPKKFHWIGIVDGDWGVSKKEPRKYMHMLQMAGYDKIFCAADLIDSNLDVIDNNALASYLINDLQCRKKS